MYYDIHELAMPIASNFVSLSTNNILMMALVSGSQLIQPFGQISRAGSTALVVPFNGLSWNLPSRSTSSV
jgi:hypothetical protein